MDDGTSVNAGDPTNKSRVDNADYVQAAIKVGQELLKSGVGAGIYPDEQKWLVFEALLSLNSSEDNLRWLKAGKPEDCSFCYDEIGDAIFNNPRHKSKTDKSPTGNEIRKLLKAVIAELNDLKPELVRIAQKEHLGFIPCIKEYKSKGGAGNKAKFYIDAVNISSIDSHITNHHDTPTNGIRYELNKDIAPSWLFNLIHSYKDTSAGVFRYLSFFVIPLLLLATSIIVPTFVHAIGNKLAMWTAMIGITIFMLTFRHLWTLMGDNIAMIPDWWTLERGAVVVHWKNKSGEGNYALKNVSFHVYRATCAVCEHRVFLDRTSRFDRRIIGKCDQNPVEHRYTFDFTTGVGQRLN